MSLFSDLLMVNNQQFKEDDEYLYFVAQGRDGVMTLQFTSLNGTGTPNESNTPVLQYSYNKKTWNVFDVNVGCKMPMNTPVYFKAGNTTTVWSNAETYDWTWNPSVKTKAYGDLRSVLGRGEVSMNYPLVYMFHNENIIKCPNLYSPALNYIGFYNNMCSYSGTIDAPAIYATGNVSLQAFANMFRNSTALITAPDFTSVNNNAVEEYIYAFAECNSLTEMAKTATSFNNGNSMLKATYRNCTSLVDTDRTMIFNYGLGSEQMASTFYNCTSITSTPSIAVSSTIGTSAFSDAFYGCSNLVDAHIDLSGVTGLSSTGSNFYRMFYNCSKLKNAPIAPTSTLSAGPYAFYNMFYGCTDLEEAPDFKFTSVSSYSAAYMFRNCSKIKVAPPLRPTSLVSYCYNYMFYGCTNLNTIYWHSPIAPSSVFCSNWVSGVSSTGTFYRDVDSTWAITYGVSNVPTGWKVKTLGALKFTSTGTSTIALNNNTGKTINIEYSTDRNTWAPLTSTAVSFTGNIYIRGKNPDGLSLTVFTAAQQDKSVKFSITGDNVSVKGNIMSLIDYEKPSEIIPAGSGFMRMFENCKALTDISGLEMPYTDINEDYQLYRMFYGSGITSLDNVTLEFPSVTGTSAMYEFFATAPTVSTPNIHIYGDVGEGSLNSMFKNCTSLTKINTLKVDGTLGENALYYMFRNCDSLVTLNDKIKFNFKNMQSRALGYMFENCTSLNDDNIDLSNCSCDPNATGCFQYMFIGCTSLETMPELPDGNIVPGQYAFMFKNCQKLKYSSPIKGYLPSTSQDAFREMFTNCLLVDEVHLEIDGDALTVADKSIFFTNWLNNVASEGIVHTPLNCVLQRDSASGIPVGWTRSADIPGTMKIVLTDNASRNSQNYFSICCNGLILDEYGFAVSKENSYAFSDFSDSQWEAYTNRRYDNSIMVADSIGNIKMCYTTSYEKGKTIYLRGVLKTNEILALNLLNSYSVDSSQKNILIHIDDRSRPLPYVYFKCYGDIRHLTEDNEGNMPYAAPKYIFSSTLQNNNILRAPEMGFTEANTRSFQNMFANCQYLERSPELNFEMTDFCCEQMFSGCTRLNYIKCASNTIGLGLSNNWVNLVARQGTYYGPATEPIGINGIPTNWVTKRDLPANAFKITGASSISLTNYGNNDPFIEYSTDNGKHWDTLTSLTDITTPVYLRGKNPTGISSSSTKYTTIQMTARDVAVGCKASGNIIDLLDYETRDMSNAGSYCFYRLFYNQPYLTDVSELIMPNTTTSYMCSYMFGYAGISKMPQLPATTLQSYCYQHMFDGCTSLTSLTHIPATNFGTYSCSYMFANCTNLVNAYDSEFSTVVDFANSSCTYNNYALSYMFYRCSKLKIVSYNSTDTSKNLPIKITLSSIPLGLYSYIFYNCSALVDFPITIGKDAISYGDYAFRYAYAGTGVTSAQPFFGSYSVKAASTSAYAFYYMFSNCAQLKTGYIPKVTTTAASSLFGYMYANSTITSLAVMPADISITTNMLNYCCSGCTSLKNIQWALTVPPSATISSNWLSGASTTGTFDSSFTRAQIVESVSGVPSTWTIVTQ